MSTYTGEKLIRASQWQPLDGSTNNNIPRSLVLPGTQTQKNQVPVWSFDGAGSTPQYLCYQTRVPNDYVSGGTIKFIWMANTTTGNVKWNVRFIAISAGQTSTPLNRSWAGGGSVTDAVDVVTTRGMVESAATSLNLDSAVAADHLSILIWRDPSDAADTCTADAELMAVVFQYTGASPTSSALTFTDTTARNAYFTSPVEGDECYVTGTHTKYIYDGTTWAAWDQRPQTWTPTLTQGGTVTFTVARATYTRKGPRTAIEVRLNVTGGSASAGSTIVLGNLPVNAGAAATYGDGVGFIYDAAPSSLVYPMEGVVASGTTIQFVDTTAPTSVTVFMGQSGSAFALALANGDAVGIKTEYDTIA